MVFIIGLELIEILLPEVDRVFYIGQICLSAEIAKKKNIFLIITSKRLKLQSRAKSQIIGNSFALLYVLYVLKSV